MQIGCGSPVVREGPHILRGYCYRPDGKTLLSEVQAEKLPSISRTIEKYLETSRDGDSAIVAQQVPTGTPKTDGRKRRWHRHKVERRNDLTTAVTMRFAQITLIPNMAKALSSNLDGFDLTREIIRVYVETVASEPEPYRFAMANNSAGKNKVVADSERIIARMLAVMLRRRMRPAGMDLGGGGAWADMIVGGVT